MAKTQLKPRTIKGRELVNDVRTGMTDFELSAKYGLTLQDFDRVLGYLVDAGLITKRELLEHQQLSNSQIIRAFVEWREGVRIVD